MTPPAQNRSVNLPHLTPHALRAALALTEIHFPMDLDGQKAIDPRDARFLLSGQLGLWARWREQLPASTASKIDRLIKARPRRLATESGFRVSLEAHLRRNQSPRYRPEGDLLLIGDGNTSAEVLNNALTELEVAASARHWLPEVAVADRQYTSSVFLASSAGTDEFRRSTYWIPNVPVADTPLTILDGTSPQETRVTPDALLARARRIDDRRNLSGFSIADRLAAFMSGLRLHGDLPLTEFVLTAGRLNLGVAPTGTGKSIFLRVLAVHLAATGHVTVLVTPDIETSLDLVAEIRADLRALEQDVVVTALLSPREMINVAVKHTNDPNRPDRGHWTWNELGYSCMLPATDGPGWQPGQEPCTDLHDPGQEGRSRCPFIPVCGKWRPWRDAAATAKVIITNHAYFQNGSVPVPVVAGGQPRGRISAQEFLLRRADHIFVDEIDAFQAHAVAQSGRTLALARRDGGPLILEQLDRQRREQVSAGTVPGDLELDFQRVLTQLRYLPERYLAAVFNGFIDPRDPLGPKQARLHLPRRWDNLLACRLFGLDELADRPSDEQLEQFESLFHHTDPEDPLPAGWDELRFQLRLVVSQAPSADRIEQRRQDVIEGLAGIKSIDVVDPLGTAQLLMRRAFLGEIQRSLSELEQLLPLMRDAGMRLADDVEAALDRGSSWQATPEGPIGRSIFGFAVTGDLTKPDEPKLKAEIISGDPHTYTAELGLTTAPALTGSPKIVMGLSATAYLPGSPTFHVHSPVSWYLPDSSAAGTGAVSIRDGSVSDLAGRGIVISGADRRRKSQLMVEIGTRLWEQNLDARLSMLREHPDPQMRRRARLLLVTNSYLQAVDLCVGLIKGGAQRSRLAVAVPAMPEGEHHGLDIPEDVLAIPANRLKTFPRHDRDVLISPFARVARGLNMVVDDKSAIESIWVCVRPIKLIDEPSALVAHTGAHSRLGRQSSPHPTSELAQRHHLAAEHLEFINRANPAFGRLPIEVRTAIFADVLADLIQLAGRARRGGTDTTLFLVDNAFHPGGSAPGSDFRSLFRRLHQQWHDTGTLQAVNEIFGSTIHAFEQFANGSR